VERPETQPETRPETQTLTSGPTDWKEDQNLPQEFINNAKERPESASSGLVAVRTFPRDSMNIRSTRDTR
jgi:hypothetical protein